MLNGARQTGVLTLYYGCQSLGCLEATGLTWKKSSARFSLLGVGSSQPALLRKSPPGSPKPRATLFLVTCRRGSSVEPSFNFWHTRSLTAWRKVRRQATGNKAKTDRVASRNRLRRPAGEGMARGRATAQPLLKVPESSSYCQIRRVNTGPREKPRVGNRNHCPRCSKCEATDRRAVPPKLNPLTLMGKGCLCSLPPSKPCPSKDKTDSPKTHLTRSLGCGTPLKHPRSTFSTLKHAFSTSTLALIQQQSGGIH